MSRILFLLVLVLSIAISSQASQSCIKNAQDNTVVFYGYNKVDFCHDIGFNCGGNSYCIPICGDTWSEFNYNVAFITWGFMVLEYEVDCPIPD